MKLLKTLWKYWMKIAKPIGNFQARIFFSIFYFLILGLIGIPFSLFSDPLLVHKGGVRKKSFFTKWDHKIETLEESRKPF